MDGIIEIPTLSDVIVRLQQSSSLTATRPEGLEQRAFELPRGPGASVERLTENRLGRYVNHLADTASTVGRHMFLAKLRDAIRVMFPGKVPPHLSRLVARLERECEPRSMAERKVTTPRLTALGEKLMKDAAAAERSVASFVTYRDGLMIALLSVRPVRRHMLSLIRISVHLRQVGEEWRIVFDGSETKSGRPFETAVPQRIAPFLEHYLREVRPMVLGANRHQHLWASTKGIPLTDKAIYRIIINRTLQALGQPVNPHLFRHCAATTVAILQPGRILVARDLLDHVSMTTTKAHYIKARSIEASRHYAGVLKQLRSTLEILGRQSLKRARNDRKAARRTADQRRDLAFELALAERLRELKVQRIVREINCSRKRVSTRKLDLVIFSALLFYGPKSDALAESEGCHKRSSARQPSLAFRACCNHLAGKKGSDTRKAQ